MLNLSFMFKCIFGCLVPQSKSSSKPNAKSDNEIQAELSKIGSTTEAFTNLTHNKTQSFGPKYSFSKSCTILQKLDHSVDPDQSAPNNEDDKHEETTITDFRADDTQNIQHKSFTESKSYKTVKFDSLTVDYKPKNTIITRSLPQFEPERKSRFALDTPNLKKSRSTNSRKVLFSLTKEEKKTHPKRSKSGTPTRKNNYQSTKKLLN